MLLSAGVAFSCASTGPHVPTAEERKAASVWLAGLGKQATPEGLDRIRTLGLFNATLRDRDLRHLRALPNLEGVSIGRTQVTDEGVAILARLPRLHVVDLSYLPITDSGLEELHRLARLTRIGVYGTRVTEAGAAALRRRFPTVRIKHRCGVRH